ncbi:phosphopantetheine-binding protein, partial [Aquimarina algiphila]|uniref:phosphopantetheine-binding protein n=1 Tax=Aquimarina algiphila TaxID=2047982 RepID=UPI00232DE8E1
ESELVSIWEEVLGREGIGVKDDFFELGGHSLKVLLVIQTLQQRMNVKISLVQFFNNSTIENLTEIIKSISHKEEDISKLKGKKRIVL